MPATWKKNYAAKYRDRGEPIHPIGVEFSRDTRNVTSFRGTVPAAPAS